MDSWDGQPQVPGFDERLTGRLSAFSIVGLTTGVVVGRLYADEVGNRSRVAVEYVVRDLTTGSLYPYAVVVSSLFGTSNGEETVLRPASTNLQGRTFDASTVSASSDGDIVLVGFVGGSRGRPVILGALPHPASIYGARKADGERRYLQHQGTQVQVKKDGAASVERKGSSVEIAASGDIFVQHRSGSFIKITTDGLAEEVATGLDDTGEDTNEDPIGDLVEPTSDPNDETDGNIFIQHHSGAKVRVVKGVVKVDGVDESGVLLGFAATEKVVRGTSFDENVAQPASSAATKLLVKLGELAASVIAKAEPLTTNDDFLTLIEAVVKFATSSASAFAATTATLSEKVRTE